MKRVSYWTVLVLGAGFGSLAIAGEAATEAGRLAESLRRGAVEQDPFADVMKLEARVETVRGTSRGRVVVAVQLVPGAHIMALSQKGTPPPTRITVQAADEFKTTDAFQADKPPTVVEHDPIFDNRLEKHYGRVELRVPIELAEGADAQKLKVQLVFNGQVCTDDGTCIPVFGKRLEATWRGYYEEPPEEPADRDAPPRPFSTLPDSG